MTVANDWKYARQGDMNKHAIRHEQVKKKAGKFDLNKILIYITYH